MQQQRNVPSPCVSICLLDEDNVCTGCLRSANEITHWGIMTDDEKREVYRNIEQRAKQKNVWLTGGQ